MPSAADFIAKKLIKLLYIGDSGSGKSGSLASLVAAGYKIRMIDMDVGIETLIAYAKHTCPDKLGNIEYVSLRDKRKAMPNGAVVLPGSAKAFVGALKFLDKWEDGSIPAEWGPDHILVLDSLSTLGSAAFEWAKGMNPGSKDPRQWYGAGMQQIEAVLSLLTDESFNTNVIVISHVKYVEDENTPRKGYANALGTALGPVIPRYFNTMIQAESEGFGKFTKRTIKTVPSGIVDLKNPISFKLPASLPLESGMADIFAALKEG